jgi:hypothetical protein
LQLKKENVNRIHPRAAMITVIVVAAALLRMVPHPMNFAPIGALALFGGAYYSNKCTAVAVPLFALVAGDIFTGLDPLIPFVYASFLVSVAIGFWLRANKSAWRIGGATVAGAIQFFLITNFALWASSISNYPKNGGGLAACYIAGLPLFWNTLAGDAFYVAVLFGVMALTEKRFPSLREPLAARSSPKLAFR